MIKNDIIEGIYLKQLTKRSGTPAGLIGVVHQVSTDWTGEWSFHLRYLDQPEGTRTRQVWSLNLREKDLDDFELIGPWLTAQALLTSPGKQRKATYLKVPAWMRGKWHPNQLRLFDDY